MPRHILDQYMLSAILACAFLAVFYSCDITENSVFIKILGRIIVIFFVLHKSCKVVVGHIARGLVAFDTFLVRIYQVIIQRCCICVASVTFSALELAKIAVHGLFMDVAMGCIMENSVTKGARPFLVKGLVILTHLLLFAFIHHAKFLLWFSILVFNINVVSQFRLENLSPNPIAPDLIFIVLKLIQIF